MNNVCVLGSINMDLVISVDRIPCVGETIFGNSMNKFPGGKGANQAVAMSRLGTKVSFIGCVGNDADGSNLLTLFEKEGMDLSGILVDSTLPTGLALINVDALGNNNIIVVSGANQKIQKKEVQDSKQLITDAELLISQFEVPIVAVIEAFSIAKANNTLTVLNPSPVTQISSKLYSLTDFLILNEHEAHALNDLPISSKEEAFISAKELLTRGVSHVLLTLGANGVVYAARDCTLFCPAQKVHAIDTTAAGDAFLGAFCNNLSRTNLTPEAILRNIEFANQVAAIVVQRKGAQSSLPYRKELSFL